MNHWDHEHMGFFGHFKIDVLVKSLKGRIPVIPAQAGIQ